MIRFCTFVFIIILICLFCNSIYSEGTNLIKNPSFEEINNGVPLYWSKEAYPSVDNNKILFSIDRNAHSGKVAYSLNNQINGVSLISQNITVQLGKIYKISVWLKTENIDKQNLAAANIAILNGIFETPNIFDTNGSWRKIEAYVRIRDKGSNIMKFALRLGGFGTNAKGKVYFDDVRMELVEKPPKGVEIGEFFVPGENSIQERNNKVKINMGNLLYILAGLFIIVLLIFIEIRFIGVNDGKELTVIKDSDDE